MKAKDPSRFRVISPSLPGHGGSDTDPKRSITSFDADMIELLDHLNISKDIIVAGMSWGGTHDDGSTI